MSFPNHGGAAPGCAGHCCLEVRTLGVHLDEADILRDLNFHLHCGEIVALIGPNGAGKTSLFSAILGQIPHTGEIVFSRAGGKRGQPLIGYVPQSPAFDPGDPVSVLDFFLAATARRPAFLPAGKAAREKVASCLRRVQAEGLINKRLGTLSGGELQRVLLALALEPLPQILILDEPLSGVDIEGEEQLLAMLDALRRRYDLSILFSTHDFSALERYADKVMLLQQELRKVGSPQEVLSSPEFRAAFHLQSGKRREGGWSL